MSELKNDPVNNPSHYTQGDVECIDAIRSMLGRDGFIAFCQGNAMKYLWRHQHKENPIQDLKKAEWYMERIADTLIKAAIESVPASVSAQPTAPTSKTNVYWITRDKDFWYSFEIWHLEPTICDGDAAWGRWDHSGSCLLGRVPLSDDLYNNDSIRRIALALPRGKEGIARIEL